MIVFPVSCVNGSKVRVESHIWWRTRAGRHQPLPGTRDDRMDPALTDAIATMVRSQQGLHEMVARSQQALQEAMAQLAVQTARSTADKSLTKLTADDDVEAYLELFERVATREGWPRESWAHTLAPFLTGEAQQACRDLSPREAANYDELRTAILARYGFSLPARALQVHQWTFDPMLPARAQVKGLHRLTNRAKSICVEGTVPSALPYPGRPFRRRENLREGDGPVLLAGGEAGGRRLLPTVPRMSTPQPPGELPEPPDPVADY